MKKIFILILVVFVSLWSVPIHANDVMVPGGYSNVCSQTVIQDECVSILPRMGVELYQLSFDYAQGLVEDKDFTTKIGNIIRKHCDSANVQPALIVKVSPVKQWLSSVMKLGAREGERQLAFEGTTTEHSIYKAN